MPALRRHDSPPLESGAQVQEQRESRTPTAFDLRDLAQREGAGMTLESFAQALGARKRGAQYWALCPVHEADNRQHRPSLAITECNGKILLHCWAGCAQRDVIGRLEGMGLWRSRQITVWDSLRMKLEAYRREAQLHMERAYAGALDPLKLAALAREDWPAYRRYCREQGQAWRRARDDK